MARRGRSEEHTSELQSRNDISYAVFCLKKKKKSLPSATWIRLAYGYSPSYPSKLFRLVSVPFVVILYTFLSLFSFFFFNEPATTEIYTSLHTLSLHDALPILPSGSRWPAGSCATARTRAARSEEHTSELQSRNDISYAVFCLKKKKPK